MNSDALELLGHATHQLSMHRQQAIIPFLHKQYAAPCFPHGPFTEFLFGDELQAQLNNIKATNKIGNAMASKSPTQPAKRKQHWKTKNRGSFLGGTRGQAGPTPCTNKSSGKRTVLNILLTVQVQDSICHHHRDSMREHACTKLVKKMRFA